MAGEQEPRLAEPGSWPTPQQWVWMWEDALPERRLEIATQVIRDAQEALNCAVLDHDQRIADLDQQLNRAITAGERLATINESLLDRCRALLTELGR